MSWSDSKPPFLQGSPTLYVEVDAQKTKPKAIFRVGGVEGIYRLFVWGVEKFNPLVLLITHTKVK